MADGALDPTHAKNLGLLADLFRMIGPQPTPSGPVGLAGGRLSSNFDDYREGGGWNAKAKKAIADQFGSINQVKGESDLAPGVEVPGSRPGVAGKTPDNLSIEDLFTRSQQHPQDFDNDTYGIQNVLANAEAKSTQTPGLKPNQMDMATGAWQTDGSTNPPPVNGMATQMMPQTLTPPSIPPAPAEALGTMNAPMPTLPAPAPGASAAPPSPDIMGALRSLFGIG